MKAKLSLILLSLVFLAACAPAQAVARPLAGLPDDARTLVLMLITAALTAGVAWVAAKTGVNLGGYIEPVALMLSGIVITFIEQGLGMIPPIFDDLVLSIIHVIVLALGGGLSLLIVRKARKGETRSLLQA